MITSRVMVHFDDLLSVVNDAQLKSALNTYKEITQLMKRASEQRKRKAGDKLTVGVERAHRWVMTEMMNAKVHRGMTIGEAGRRSMSYELPSCDKNS